MGGLYLGDKLVTPVVVEKEEVAKTKFGASVDTWIGDVDENGVLRTPAWTGALNFAGVKEIGEYGLQYAFHMLGSGITSVDLSSLTTVGDYGLRRTFADCSGITSVDLSSLTTVGAYGLYQTFDNCQLITSVDLSSLTTVGEQGLLQTFYRCKAITSVNLSSLTTVGAIGMQRTFDSCSGLTTISFPLLTDVQSNSFGSTTSNGVFRNCTALTEIHFRADMQATIEAMTGYANKFGATNAVIYFDL